MAHSFDQYLDILGWYISTKILTRSVKARISPPNTAEFTHNDVRNVCVVCDLAVSWRPVEFPDALSCKEETW